MICIDKNKLLSGFTGKLHFVSSVVKRRYFVKISHTACSSLSNFLILKVQISFKKKVKLTTLKSRNLMRFLHVLILVKIDRENKTSRNTV